MSLSPYPPQQAQRHNPYGLAHPALAPDEMIPAHRGAVSMWTNVKRNGDWILPRVFRAVAVMGGVELDLRNARMGAGMSTIEVRAFWGSIDILVPNDVHVDCDVDAPAGSAEVKYETPSLAAPDAPRLRITGTVIMASVNVKVVPRETMY